MNKNRSADFGEPEEFSSGDFEESDAPGAAAYSDPSTTAYAPVNLRLIEILHIAIRLFVVLPIAVCVFYLVVNLLGAEGDSERITETLLTVVSWLEMPLIAGGFFLFIKKWLIGSPFLYVGRIADGALKGFSVFYHESFGLAVLDVPPIADVNEKLAGELLPRGCPTDGFCHARYFTIRRLNTETVKECTQTGKDRMKIVMQDGEILDLEIAFYGDKYAPVTVLCRR